MNTVGFVYDVGDVVLDDIEGEECVVIVKARDATGNLYLVVINSHDKCKELMWCRENVLWPRTT